jgi:Fe-S-cluster containining protein
MKIAKICSEMCFGIPGNSGSCCHVDRNWILGPILDHERFLENLSTKIGRNVEFNEVFYDYIEGSKVFPYYESWRDEDHYPAFKVDLEKSNRPCVMYNSATKSCSVYEIRPETCRSYTCKFLKDSIEK